MKIQKFPNALIPRPLLPGGEGGSSLSKCKHTPLPQGEGGKCSHRRGEGFWLFLVLLFLVSYFLPAYADSVWNQESASPYSTEKNYKVGDIINVLIIESTSASNKAGTNTSVKDDLGMKFQHTFQRLAPIIGVDNSASGNLSNKYAGAGDTSRSSRVQARIAAWVTEVLPNGNLAIKGRHKVEVNDEAQEIEITGVVRPKDISGANTIYSYQVANAEMAVKGTGVVADTEEPGWLTRLFNWLF